MRSFTIKASGAVAISVGLLTAIPAVAAPILFNVGGSDAASIGATVAAFRLALGDPNNANTQGPSPPNYAGSAALLTAFDMRLDPGQPPLLPPPGGRGG